MANKVNSPFSSSGEVFKGTEFQPRDEVTFSQYYLKEKISYLDDNDPSNYLIEYENTEYDCKPLNAYIESFASKVGIVNILKNITTQAEADELMARSVMNGSGKVIDVSKFEGLSDLDIERIIESGNKAWESLDPELKKDMDKAEFLRSLTQEQLDSYIMSVVHKKLGEQSKEEK